ncbi:MAG: sulfite exporter TauE/SafE family protein [Candidatus Saccharimonadales bacterium]
MIEKAILVVITGILVGAINSIAGGGMLVGFPLLLFFGLSALASNITANVIVLAGQITTSIGYRKQLKKVPIKYFWLILPTIIGSLLGAFILRKTPNSKFVVVAPVLIMLAVLLFMFQPYLKQRMYRVAGLATKNDRPSAMIFLFVFLLSIYGGYFGAGYGLVMLAILSFSKLKNIYEMNALKNFCAILIALCSLVILFTSHLINWRYGITMAFGTAIGGFLGAKIAFKLPMPIIRYFVIVIGLATAIYLYSQSHIFSNL